MKRKDIVNKSQNNKYATRKEVLTSFFLNEQYKLATRKQIISLFRIPKNDLDILDSILNELQEQGIIYLDDSKRYVPIANKNLVKCTYQAKSGNYGFGIVEDGEDFYISSKNLNGAMNGDDVLVEILKYYWEKQRRKSSKNIKRNVTQVVGRFEKSRNFGFVIPIDDTIQDIYISKKNSTNIKNGQVVQVKIEKYPTENTKAEGKIIQIIGNSNDINIDAKSLYISYGLDKLEKFNESVQKEVESIPQNVLAIEKKNRVDRTNERVYTIDAADAKDLDDAVSVKKQSDGSFLLSVYIADVSHYVKENTALDKEAIARGTSIYIPSRVIPMLPKELSNGICSLNAGVERLALGVDILISKMEKS